MYTKQSYTPSKEILEKYAKLLVRFGMQTNGKPLMKGSVVRFIVPEIAKPMYFYLQREILKAGYQPLGVFLPSDDDTYEIEKDYFEHAKTHQLEHFSEHYQKGLIDQIDGSIRIIAESSPHALANVSAKKVMLENFSMMPFKSAFLEKAAAGKMAWTLGLYGTDASAKEAGMNGKDFWEEIIRACYLDAENPIKEWKRIDRELQRTAQKLTKLNIKSVHLEGKDIDLTIGIGKDRKWAAAGGYNIPSYEVFTSPDYRQVNGWARFNQPHYRYGKKIDGIELWFKDGKVIKSKASKNHDLLKGILNTPGGNQIGEFSLTDSRLSRITKFMADILYDENMGGKYGNTHVALGSSYHECYSKNPAKVSKEQWEKLGFNDSAVHSDVISTTDRTVTATLYDGTEKVIYKKGQFTI